MRKIKFLFAHNAYLGQFESFGPWLRDQGHDVTVLHREGRPDTADLPSLQFQDFQNIRAKGQAGILREVENSLATGMGAAQAALNMRAQGFQPDVIISHCGWGTGSFLKNIWPEAVYIAYHEWLYRRNPLTERDVITRMQPEDLVNTAHDLARNMPIVTEFINADACWSPNHFQADQFPKVFRDRITVTHDGVDVDRVKPCDNAKIDFPWLDLSGCNQIITYVGRGFEPTRGFPEFMQAMTSVLDQLPEAQVVIIGENRTAYSEALPPEDSWLHRMIDKLDIDLSRVHFTGKVSHSDLHKILSASSVHVYLSVPFVVSWSLAEAMALKCLVVAADHPGTRELITDTETGFLVGMSDTERLARKVINCVKNQEKFLPVREAAHAHIVANFSQQEMFKKRLVMIDELLVAKRRM